MIRAVIFDLDGVIIQTEHLVSRAYDDALRSIGKAPIPYEDGLIQPIGLRTSDQWPILKDRYAIVEDQETFAKRHREAYIKLLKENMEPMPNLLDLLEYLKTHGIRMAVATGSQTLVDMILKDLRIFEYFDAVVKGRDVKMGKPDPESYLLASEKIGIRPQECLVIEDTAIGIAAGKSAGMTVVALSHEYNKKQDFSNADLVVSSLIDARLTKLIGA